MAHRSQSSSVGENTLCPNYVPPHYKEEYRLAIDALVEHDLKGYYEFLQSADQVEFLCRPEIEHIKATLQTPHQGAAAPGGVPELTYPHPTGGDVEEDGSSDTYWPMHSDIAAPGLDLGWPLQQHSFIGPTEVTTLVNPSDPDMPSVKMTARRLIKEAQHVIAIVMDMFTDVDIFSDLLDAAARHVPVYILLDEQNAHHFIAMAANCRVNLDLVHMMRVRTVAGITYFCRTGKSFKGQVKDRFLLSDCRAVLSGNYSFMWSYEKIHRCIAHLFLGELVATFDEEFRILFAQSEPLSVSEHALAPLGSGIGSESSSTSSYLSGVTGLKRTQSLRMPRGFLPSPSPYGGGGVELPSAALPGFRRNELFRHSSMDLQGGGGGVSGNAGTPGGITIGKYSQQQFRLQQSFLEQGRSIVSRQMEMSQSASSNFKRHSYAEGTQENYSSSRHFMKSRVMTNLEETSADLHREQSQSNYFYQEGGGGGGPGSGHGGHYDRLRGQEGGGGGGPGSGHGGHYDRLRGQEGPGGGGPGSGHGGHYDRLRGRAAPHHLAIDQYSDSSFRSEPDAAQPPPHYGGRDYLSSDDLQGGDAAGPNAPPAAGRYDGGQSSHRRPTVGQAYACQSSPTQPHAPDNKHLFAREQHPAAGPAEERDADPDLRQGLRSWRINSYLSAYEEDGGGGGGDEGLPQPMGHSDAFDDEAPQHTSGVDSSAPRFGTREQQHDTQTSSKPLPAILRPRYGKPVLPEKDSTAAARTTTTTNKWDAGGGGGTSLGADFKSSILEKERLEREKEWERGGGGVREVGVDVDFRESPPPPEHARNESFRTRINPMLQRSSRLRSSLIFSSSKVETHSGGLGLKTATEEDEELDPMRTSSIVAQILEKRRSMSREPYEWKKKADEMEKERSREKELEQDKERRRRASLREEELEKPKVEPPIPKPSREVWSPPETTTTTTTSASYTEQQQQQQQPPPPSQPLNMNDPASRLQYFKDLAAKRKASKMAAETTTTTTSLIAASPAEPAERKADVSDKPPPPPTAKAAAAPPPPSRIPSVSVDPPPQAEPTPEPKKPDVVSKPPPVPLHAAELVRKPSLNTATAYKPPAVFAKPALVQLRLPSEPANNVTAAISSEQQQAPKKESSSSLSFKSLKPLPSPKIFKRDPLKLKGLGGSRRSCDEEMLTATATATDAEKSEMKKGGRSHSSSSFSLTRSEAKDGLQKNTGSSSSINTLGLEGGKAEGKPLDFLKKQTQRLKGFLGPKEKKSAPSGDDVKSMSTVREIADLEAAAARDQTATSNHRPAQTTTSGGGVSASRYQTGGSVMFSSNLRDDTKVILGQISAANSQKNRLERGGGEEAGGDHRDGIDGGGGEKGLERLNSLKKSRFLQRPQANPQEREGLLKRIESMRKEKKVYSRFEMGNSLG